MTALQMLSSPLLLIPAYGAVYRTVAEMQAAWDKGIDFKMYGNGQYCSIRNLKALAADASSVTLVDPRHKGVVIKVA
jgi:hypothetical protein